MLFLGWCTVIIILNLFYQFYDSIGPGIFIAFI